MTRPLARRVVAQFRPVAPRGGSGRSLHAIQVGSSVEMAPGLRELSHFPCSQALVLVLRWLAMTFSSPLFLAAPAQ
jgi:hypothetical protein